MKASTIDFYTQEPNQRDLELDLLLSKDNFLIYFFWLIYLIYSFFLKKKNNVNYLVRNLQTYLQFHTARWAKMTASISSVRGISRPGSLTKWAARDSEWQLRYEEAALPDLTQLVLRMTYHIKINLLDQAILFRKWKPVKR